MSTEGTIVAVCVSEGKGTPKRAVSEGQLLRGHGLEGDGHAGNWHRQISLLANEQIAAMRAAGLELEPGAFGENLVTQGLDLRALAVGRRVRVGPEAILQITQRGKACHTRCRIYEKVGDCVMPREGLFARVVRRGLVRPGDPVALDAALDRARWAVVTLSARGAARERADRSGQLVCELLAAALGGEPVSRLLLADDRARIASELRRLCDEEVCDLIVTTGGTGLSPRDVTPEATADVIDRTIPGMAEAIRAAGLRHTARAMLSRGIAGLRGQSIIVNLSGSPQAVEEQLAAILPALPHAVAIASGIPVECAASPEGGT